MPDAPFVCPTLVDAVSRSAARACMCCAFDCIGGSDAAGDAAVPPAAPSLSVRVVRRMEAEASLAATSVR
jgi:hypothetical protein